jgi:LemA protein
MMIAAIIILVVLAIFAIALYNGLIRKRNEVENAFGGMDVQLKKRYDLIPNLVATVQQYAMHEKELLEKVTQLRNQAVGGNLSNDEKVALNNSISGALREIMVTVENYPDLKANTNFLDLQRALNEVESQISASRRTYNATVTDFNNAIETFPGNLMAGIIGFTRKSVFEIPDSERQNVNVNDLFKR